MFREGLRAALLKLRWQACAVAMLFDLRLNEGRPAPRRPFPPLDFRVAAGANLGAIQSQPSSPTGQSLEPLLAALLLKPSCLCGSLPGLQACHWFLSPLRVYDAFKELYPEGRAAALMWSDCVFER